MAACIYFMYDKLIGLDGNQKAPGIAESWETSADGLSWTFHIRKGVKFHNGEELTAEDVKFTLDLYLSDEAAKQWLQRMIERVEMLDDYTVRVYTKGTQPWLLTYLGGEANNEQGMAMPKDYREQHGSEYFNLHPVGSGSFKFVRHLPGDLVEYEAVDNHWQHTPAFKNLTVMTVPEETTRVAMLKTGEVDLTDVEISAAADLEKAGTGFTTITRDLTTASVHFFGAYDEPRAAGMPTTDIRVRKALSLAIDRDSITAYMFSGQGQPAMAAAAPPALGVTDVDQPYWREYCKELYRYDPEEARRLLNEAGYPDGFDMKMYSFALTPWLPTLNEAVTGYWQAIGVNVTLVPIEFAAFRPLYKDPGPDLWGNAAGWRAGGQIGFEFFIVYHSKGYMKNMRNPELDAAIEAAETAIDPAERTKLAREAARLAKAGYNFIPILALDAVAAMGKKIGGWTPISGFEIYGLTYETMTHAD